MKDTITDPESPKGASLTTPDYEASIIQIIEMGREFCKYMTTVSLGSIPVFLGLLALVGFSSIQDLKQQPFLVFSPAALFLITSLVFILGYFPLGSLFFQQTPADTLDKQQEIQRYQRRVIATGLLIFSLSVSFAIAVITITIVKI
ncbi:MAG: hypothetical protein HY666_05395 [Chloroflexi bacterium]|nr:hypothetical protein [Chloroflexota bacterium]